MKKTAYIIVSSDRGLAGGYNSNIFRAADDAMEERHASKDDVKIVAIGRKGLEFFERLGYEVVESSSVYRTNLLSLKLKIDRE